jgi:thiamine-monophosphate kinase
VNLSDLAAMAARPEALLLSMCLPVGAGIATETLAAEIFEGVCEMAERFGVAIAGGDTNCWSGPLALNVTATGKSVDGILWTRSGAQAGDLVVVTGPLGGSLLGKHLDFLPRLELSEQLRSAVLIHAAMDISDGLSLDLLRLCDASACGAVLTLGDIPIAPAAVEMSRTSGRTPLEHALGDGEDFELLFALPPEQLANFRDAAGAENVHVCGAFTSRTGLWAREGTRIRQLKASGYIHGAAG